MESVLDVKASGLPKISVLDVNSIRTRFRLDHCSLGLINALRRVPITDLPTLAIDKILIINRTTAQSDMFLRDALSGVPIQSERVLDFRLPNLTHAPMGVPSNATVCRCADGCPYCETVFSLQYTHTTIGTVAHLTSRDLKPVPHPKLSDKKLSFTEEERKWFALRDQTVKPIAIGVIGLPLCSVHYMQEVHVICYVRRGTTLQHARWKPGEVSFRPIFTIPNPNNKRLEELGITAEQKREMQDEDNDGVWKVDEKSGHFYVTDPLRYTRSKNLWEKLNTFLVDNPKAGPDDNGPALFPAFQNGDSYLMTIEPYGQIASGTEIVRLTCHHLIERLKRMMYSNIFAQTTMNRSQVNLNEPFRIEVQEINASPCAKETITRVIPNWEDPFIKLAEAVSKSNKVSQHLLEDVSMHIKILHVMIAEEDTTIINLCRYILNSDASSDIMSATFQQSDPIEGKIMWRIQTKNDSDPNRAWHNAMVLALKQLQALASQLDALRDGDGKK